MNYGYNDSKSIEQFVLLNLRRITKFVSYLVYLKVRPRNILRQKSNTIVIT